MSIMDRNIEETPSSNVAILAILRLLVNTATIGSGDYSERPTDEFWDAARARLCRDLSPLERDFVRRQWDECHQAMEQP